MRNVNDLPEEVIPVKRESNHREIYDSTHIRVYIATLAPGQETEYHSHDVDTIYIAISGGKIQTIKHPLDQGCPTILLKQYSLFYKVRLLIEKVRNKPITLVDGFTFFMPSSRKEVVHKAIASKENGKEMTLLGIEIKTQSNHFNCLKYLDDLSFQKLSNKRSIHY